MSTEHRPLRTIFNEAVEIPDRDQRDAYLASACGKDTTLRRKIEALIQAHTEADGFLGGVGDTVARATRKAPNTDEAQPGSLQKPGDKIGRYRLVQQIGEGGCGVVYLAQQEEPGRRTRDGHTS